MAFFRIGRLVVCEFHAVRIESNINVRSSLIVSRNMPAACECEARGVVTLVMNDAATVQAIGLAVGTDGVMAVVNTSNKGISAGDVIEGSIIYVADE